VRHDVAARMISYFAQSPRRRASAIACLIAVWIVLVTGPTYECSRAGFVAVYPRAALYCAVALEITLLAVAMRAIRRKMSDNASTGEKLAGGVLLAVLLFALVYEVLWLIVGRPPLFGFLECAGKDALVHGWWGFQND